MRQYYKFRPDEVFRRITVNSLVSLMIEVGKLEIQESDVEALEEAQRKYDLVSEPFTDSDSIVTHQSSSTLLEPGPEASSFCEGNGAVNSMPTTEDSGEGIMLPRKTPSAADLVRGIGELDWRYTMGDDDDERKSQAEADSRSQTSRSLRRPYLLLDVREETEYRSGHLLTAESYCHSRLNLVNFETSCMRAFKNKADKLIIVYDTDESLSSRCASTLVQRGYDNVFMLSGGLRVAELKFPYTGLVSEGPPRQRLTEEQVVALDEGLEEALEQGSDRLSAYAPSVCSASRMGGGAKTASCSQLNVARSYDS